MQYTNKQLRSALADAQEDLWQKQIECDRLKTELNKFEKLEKEFVKLQEFANKQLTQNKNFKQAIQQLGEVIAHL